MNLELYSIQFRNPDTNEIITFTLEDYFVRNQKGKLLPKNSEEYIQASSRVGVLFGGGYSRLKEIIPNSKVSGDKEE